MNMEMTIASIILAGIIGFLVGLHMEDINTARLFSIVCMSSALITHVSTQYFLSVSMSWYADPGRLSAQVIAALGFIGTGLIWVTQDKKVKGLSTAAALWLTAIVGIVIGAELNSVSAGAIISLLIIYAGFNLLSKRIK